MGAAYWHPDAPGGRNGGPVWTAAQRAQISKAVNTYKTMIRPLVRTANLYHIFPRPTGKVWDGIEYFDPVSRKGAVGLKQVMPLGPDEGSKLLDPLYNLRMGIAHLHYLLDTFHGDLAMSLAAYNAGVGYQVADSLRPILLIKGSTPPAAGTSSLLEARLKLKCQLTTQTGIDGYIAKGITTNSPDFGAGLSVYYDF